MVTETIIEECILLAHRINKLGGCVFVYDYSHVDWMEFMVKESKEQHDIEAAYCEVAYSGAEWNNVAHENNITLSELHELLTKRLTTLLGEVK